MNGSSGGMSGKDVVMLATWCGGSVAISVGVSVWLLTSHASGVHDKGVPMSSFADYRSWASEMKSLTRGDIKQIQQEIKEIRANLRQIEQEMYGWPRGSKRIPDAGPP